jgi:hypothetical protein
VVLRYKPFNLNDLDSVYFYQLAFSVDPDIDKLFNVPNALADLDKISKVIET